ncbi:hypothetical protein [Prochlorococcus marinus]|uniref:hypothetical protein n=1 Tax=Prochlorococcus TaxID=1218 RepID=UPI0007B3868F|nr:hypothetical protein [Prochlorococcus marinus]KZR74581.1 hypothetical protein PMIT1323_02545 [Prochlorococcus marinus str. MIT 1323]
MTNFKNQITEAEFEALVMSELEDMELTPEQLAFVTGGGLWSWIKKTVKKIGDKIESTFGDGDGKHEVSDYIDEIRDLFKPSPFDPRPNPGPCR